MTGSIYKLFMGRMTEAWYQLSDEEQTRLTSEIGAEKVGGKLILECSSSWSAEQWDFFGIEEFPDIESVQEYAELLDALGWRRYADTVTILGTEWEL
jgi:hypothetical protein